MPTQHEVAMPTGIETTATRKTSAKNEVCILPLHGLDCTNKDLALLHESCKMMNVGRNPIFPIGQGPLPKAVPTSRLCRVFLDLLDVTATLASCLCGPDGPFSWATCGLRTRLCECRRCCHRDVLIFCCALNGEILKKN